MIDRVLGFLVDRLNEALQRQYPGSEPHAVMGDFGGAETSALKTNRIVLTVAQIERETGTQVPGTLRADASGYSRLVPKLNINLVVLVSANFGDNYAEALKFLSASLAFFQSAPILTAASSAAFPAGLDRLAIEFVNISWQELNSIWTLRGSFYRPSFLIKLRTIPIGANDILARTSAIDSIDVTPTSR